jgi:hypothetical protein
MRFRALHSAPPLGVLVRLACVAGAAELAMASNCDFSSPVAITLTVNEPVSAVPAGSNGPINVTIARLSGYTGAVVVSATASQAGITITPVTIPVGGTTGTLTVNIANTVPAASYPVSVSGQTDAANSYQVASAATSVPVTAPGSFTIAAPSDASGYGSVTFHQTVTILRNTYTQPVTVTAVPLYSDVAVVVSPATTNGNSVDLAITAPFAPAHPTTPITITGTGPGLTAQTITLNANIATPDYVLSASGPGTAIAAGSTGTITVNAVRDPGLTGPIALTATSTNGITIAPATMTGNSTTMTVTVPGSVTTGTYTVTVTGSYSGGATHQVTVNGGVAVTGAGYALSAQTSPLNVTAGTSQPDVVNLQRTNFTGAVTVTATTDDPNITVLVNPATATTGNSVNLTVTVAPSGTGTNGGPPVTAGTHTITLTGTSSLPIVTTTFAVVVALPTGGAPVSVAMTPSGTTPIHLATGATQKFTSWLVDAAGNRTTAAAGTSFGIVADASSVLSMPTATFDATQQLLTATGTGGANGNTAVRALYVNSSNGQSILPSVTALVIVP